MRFDWNPKKAATNAAKHGVTFQEATELFWPGVPTLEVRDPEHSEDEDRFLTIGPIARGLVVVVWTERSEDTIRIISAWLADRTERARYRKYLKGAP